MSEVFPILVDGRGVSRTIREAWLPALDVEALWFVGNLLSAPDPDDVVAPVPILPMTPFDLAVAWRERGENHTRVAAVVDSLDALAEAVGHGLPATRIILVHLDGGQDGERLAANVIVSPADLRALRALSGDGFEVLLQPLPRVTARPWIPRG